MSDMDARGENPVCAECGRGPKDETDRWGGSVRWCESEGANFCRPCRPWWDLTEAEAIIACGRSSSAKVRQTAELIAEEQERAGRLKTRAARTRSQRRVAALKRQLTKWKRLAAAEALREQEAWSELAKEMSRYATGSADFLVKAAWFGGDELRL